MTPPPRILATWSGETREVSLAFPLKGPNGPISRVRVRPVFTEEFEALRSGEVDRLEIVGRCADLTLEVGKGLSDFDHARIVEVIADLNAEGCQAANDALRARFGIVDGGIK